MFSLRVASAKGPVFGLRATKPRAALVEGGQVRLRTAPSDPRPKSAWTDLGGVDSEVRVQKRRYELRVHGDSWR